MYILSPIRHHQCLTALTCTQILTTTSIRLFLSLTDCRLSHQVDVFAWDYKRFASNFWQVFTTLSKKPRFIPCTPRRSFLRILPFVSIDYDSWKMQRLCFSVRLHTHIHTHTHSRAHAHTLSHAWTHTHTHCRLRSSEQRRLLKAEVSSPASARWDRNKRAEV
jgi:hypothetical protein